MLVTTLPLSPGRLPTMPEWTSSGRAAGLLQLQCQFFLSSGGMWVSAGRAGPLGHPGGQYRALFTLRSHINSKSPGWE